MKDKILTLIIGVLIGAIITSLCFLVYEKSNSSKNSNENEAKGFEQRDNSKKGFGDGEIPEMPEGGMPDGEVPEMPDGEIPNGENNGKMPDMQNGGMNDENNSGKKRRKKQ